MSVAKRLSRVLTLALLALLPCVAQEYPLANANSQPFAITVGPDGALWFTEVGSTYQGTIGRITTAGVITNEYSLPTIYNGPTNSGPVSIVSGPNNALWFVEQSANDIRSITTAGVISNPYPIPTANSSPSGITVGPDGALWFTETAGNNIGRLDPTSGQITEQALPTQNANPTGICLGPDNALWFTESGASQIGRITTGMVVTEYSGLSSQSGPNQIVTGPDGQLWFTESGVPSDSNFLTGTAIGRITTGGIVTEYPTPNGQEPAGIAAGADGAMWFTGDGNNIGRITTNGIITEYPITTASSQPEGVVAGPDGAMWFAEESGNNIGRFSLPLTIAQASSPVARLQMPYANTLMAAGGVLPYAWSVASGALPSGIALNTSNGQITGTPTTAGSYSFTISLTDSSPTPQTTTQPITIVVSPANVVQFATYPLTATQQPSYLTQGPNGALWFEYQDSSTQTGMLGQITTAGAITTYPVTGSNGTGLANLVLGPDGNLWFTDFEGGQAYIGDITPAGTTTEYQLNSTDAPAGLTSGPGGLLWAAVTNFDSFWTAALVGPTGNSGAGQIEDQYTLSAQPLQFATGPDNAVWFPEFNANYISRISPDGQVAQYPVSAAGRLMTLGPDQAMWFTQAANIGRIASGGSVTEFPLSYSPGNAITAGSDGALWFIGGSSGIGRMTTNGAETDFPTAISGAPWITNGPDGNIWFTTANEIVRLSFVTPLALSCTIPNQAAGVAYSGSCAASGGVPSYAYSISSGSLPPGLTLNPTTGAITGTPTTSGNYSFTVQAIDSGSPAQTVAVLVSSLVIAAGAPANIVATSGGGQSTPVNTNFANALVATVTDAYGNLVPGATVTFSAPASGASATLSSSTANTNNSGVASVTATANSIGGTYNAGASTAGVKSAALFALTNVKLTSSVGLKSSANPSKFGASVTLTATLNSQSATGTVTFYDGTNFLGAKPLSAGAASISTILLSSGTHSLTAYYPGSGSFAPARSAALQQTVNSVPATTFVTRATAHDRICAVPGCRWRF